MTLNADKDTALLASPAEAAQAAEVLLRERYNFVPLEKAEQIIALGGDGFLLQTLHEMLERGRICPIFGMNRGTVGFLMNDWRMDGLRERVNGAKAISVAPLRMDAFGSTARRSAVRRSTRSPCSARPARPPGSKCRSTAGSCFPSWSATACWSPPRRDRPPTTSPPRDRSCRWARTWSR